jgi:ABC-type uncharacterized transport system substrate-binding protein
MAVVKKVLALAVGPERNHRISARHHGAAVRHYIHGLIEGLEQKGRQIGSDYEIDYKERPHSDLADGKVSKSLLTDGDSTCDVVFAMSTNVVRAAKDASKTIPIVGVVSEPGAERFGSAKNFTGISARRSQTAGECFEYFLATVPTLKKVRVLHKPKYGPSERSLKLVKKAAGKRGVTVQVLSINTREDIEKKLKDMPKRNLNSPAEVGVQVLPVDVCLGAASLIIDIAQGQKNVPVFFPVTDFVRNGALGGYGVPQHVCGVLMADYVDRILWQSAAPKSLKIEDARGDHFEWAVSRAAAQALNIKLPHIVG